MTLKNGTLTTTKKFLEENWPRYRDMLRDMVNINSFTANPDGINQLASVTANYFAELGFSAESVRSAHYPRFGDHLVMTRQGTTMQTVGLVSHLDTVFPVEDEVANDFHWRIDGDRMYGPGTVDIKGGTVLIYMMLDAMRRFAPEQFEATTWVILLDSSEERDGDDFGALCIDRLQENGVACLIFEGGGFDGEAFPILVQRKGAAVYKVAVEGRAAHAGVSHAIGANAIVQLADVVGKIASFTDYDNELTFNVGTITGGTVTNRVPHHAEAIVEMRAFDTDVFQSGLKQILALNDYASVKSAHDDYPCDVKVEVLRKLRPWPKNAGTDGLFEYWHAAAERQGYKAIRHRRGGLSDGNYIWDVLPTIDALGPDGNNSHCSERSADGSKDQEYATQSSFVPKTLLNLDALLALLDDHKDAA